MGDVVPDYITPTIGWRVWKVAETESGACLHSCLFGGVVWPPGERMTAACLKRRAVEPHEAPGRQCVCGIYSSTDVAKIRHYLTYFGKPTLTGAAFGLVKSWGRIVECELGYRAQYAYPAHIWLPCDSHRYAEELAEYGVPVEPVGEHDRVQALMRVARETRHIYRAA